MPIGIAGTDENKRIQQAQAGLGLAGEVKGKSLAGASLGLAGNLGSGTRARISHEIVDVSAFKRRDQALSSITKESERLGDRAARESWQRGVWFSDFTYIAHSGGGRQMTWRKDREAVFGRGYRSLPLFLDCCGFRREITQTAPKWAHVFENYLGAIELLDPDGYAAWDYPNDRAKTIE